MGAEMYCRWLIPKGNEFRPSAAAVAGLVAQLRSKKWVADASDLTSCRFDGAIERLAASTGGLAVRTIDNTFGDDRSAGLLASAEPLPQELTAEWLDAPSREELRLVWPVDRKGELAPMVYPLSLFPSSGAEDKFAAYTLEVHLSSDYVHPEARDIGSIPTECTCGEDLAFEWDTDELVPAFAGSSGIFSSCEACCRSFDPSAATATMTRPFDGEKVTVRGGAAYRFAIKFASQFFVKDASLAFNRDLVKLVEEKFGREFFEVGSVYTRS